MDTNISMLSHCFEIKNSPLTNIRELDIEKVYFHRYLQKLNNEIKIKNEIVGF